MRISGKRLVKVAVVAAIAALPLAPGVPFARNAISHASNGNGSGGPPTSTFVHRKGHAHFFLRQNAPVGTNTVANLTYNGGPVMHTSHTYAIFWQPSGYNLDPPAGSGGAGSDSGFENLVTRYFNDVGNTGLYNVNTQYTDSSGAPLNQSSFAGSYVDTSVFPSSACTATTNAGTTLPVCLDDAQIQAEVSHAMSVKGWTASSTNIFFVFTPLTVGSCFDAGGTPTTSSCSFTQYCGYHSYFGSGSTTTYYANMPDPGTDASVCSPISPAGKYYLSPNNDPAADALLSVTSHEQFETVTDPQLNAWYDMDGNEIGDKCAWNFGLIGANGSSEIWNGHPYILQQEWNNATVGCVQSYPVANPPGVAGALVSFPAPQRVFSSQLTSGTTTNPIDATKKTNSAASGIPPGAKACYCAVQSYAPGVMTLFPAGTADPGIANWSGTVSGPLNLTYMMVPLNAQGQFQLHTYFTGPVYVDAWGYTT